MLKGRTVLRFVDEFDRIVFYIIILSRVAYREGKKEEIFHCTYRASPYLVRSSLYSSCTWRFGYIQVSCEYFAEHLIFGFELGLGVILAEYNSLGVEPNTRKERKKE